MAGLDKTETDTDAEDCAAEMVAALTGQYRLGQLIHEGERLLADTSGIGDVVTEVGILREKDRRWSALIDGSLSPRKDEA